MEKISIKEVMQMEILPGGPEITIKPIKEEVRQFVTEMHSYYGVTSSGLILNIIYHDIISGEIKDPLDYFGYMFVECVDGFYILRQRFVKGIALDWVLEVELKPEERYQTLFYDLRDIFRENVGLLKELCGEPIEQELPDFSKIPFCTIYERSLEDSQDLIIDNNE
ncbi:MAG: hypothetical protein K8T10_01860 [Candidatus Eremiobacteraeota bacterium]|nr:hypothetical protein [Candidatus Eremiobacteraeota bacterium]